MTHVLGYTAVWVTEKWSSVPNIGRAGSGTKNKTLKNIIVAVFVSRSRTKTRKSPECETGRADGKVQLQDIHRRPCVVEEAVGF